ncbi:MAG TPA: hypothetical protein VGC04_11270 [Cellulomonas sp.]
MIRQLASYGFGAIALYLVITQWTGFTADVAQVGSTIADVTATLQGRTGSASSKATTSTTRYLAV